MTMWHRMFWTFAECVGERRSPRVFVFGKHEATGGGGVHSPPPSPSHPTKIFAPNCPPPPKKMGIETKKAII